MAGEARGRLGADAAGAPGSGTLRLAALHKSLASLKDDQRGLEQLPSDGEDRQESTRSK